MSKEDPVMKPQSNTEHLGAPCVGYFYPTAKSGDLYLGGDVIGTLEVLGEHTPIILPADLGLVRLSGLSRSPHPCAYGEVIAQYSSLTSTSLGSLGSATSATSADSADSADSAGSAGSAGSASSTPIPQGAFNLEAPIDGTLYYAPSPDDPPFVEEGTIVQPGQVMALIEVMKFFYEIHYEGSTPVCAFKKTRDDCAPIEAGQALWCLLPVD